MGMSTPCLAASVYQQPQDFIREVFGEDTAANGKLWIDRELQAEVRRILGHDLGMLRVRYWIQGRRSAWILEAIGKDQPITAGIVVNDAKIEQIKVLIFRESRGWEIRYPFFTDQFIGAGLAQNNELSRPIDGISGATLSVQAMVKLAKLALLFHQHSTPPAER
jgi:hypothetical protein